MVGPVVAAGSSTSLAPVLRPDVGRSADRRDAARTSVDPMDAGRTDEVPPVGTRAGPPRMGARHLVVPPSGVDGRLGRARRGIGRDPTAVRPSLGRTDRSMLPAGRGAVRPVHSARPVAGPRPGSPGHIRWAEDRPVGTLRVADRRRMDPARPIGGSVRGRADAGRGETHRIARLRSGMHRGHPAHPGSGDRPRRSAARTAVDRRVVRRDAGIRGRATRRIGRRARRRVRSGGRGDGPSTVRRSGPASGAWD